MRNQILVECERLLFPMPASMLDRFQEINDFKCSVNVFMLRDAEGKEGELRSKHVDVLCITKVKDALVHINLLYLEHEGKAHYVLIKDFDKLMFGQHNKNRIKKALLSLLLALLQTRGNTREAQRDWMRCFGG